MLVDVIKQKDKLIGVTEGCGCCSKEINFDLDADRFQEELKENIELIFEAALLSGIDLVTLIKEINGKPEYKDIIL